MKSALSQRIESLAREAILPDGTLRRTIGTKQILRLSEETGATGRDVEVTALKGHILPARYLRNLQTIDETDQIRLLESAVCIIGVGGLGGLVTETLARTGVGRLHLVDDDVFEPHNLNRQLFSTNNNLGHPKVEAAVKRVRSINPSVAVSGTTEKMSPENAVELIGKSHIAVDCLDNIPSRFILSEAAKNAGLPLVSAAVAGMFGHVTTIFPDDNGMEAIFGPKDRAVHQKGVETKLGCPAPSVNFISSLECMEVLKVLLGWENTLQNKLLMVDLSDYSMETFNL